MDRNGRLKLPVDFQVKEAVICAYTGKEGDPKDEKF
jgi:hypothetical protein